MPGRCVNAEPAALLAAFEAVGLDRTFAALEATDLLVTSLALPRWVSAEPAALFAAALDFGLLSTFAAADAAFWPVFSLAMFALPLGTIELTWWSFLLPARASLSTAFTIVRCVSTDAASDFADFEAFGLLKTLPAALFSPADGVLLTCSTNRWLDTSATCFDCCLSQATLDGGKGRLTTKKLPFDLGEAVKAMAKLLLPELFEGFTMLVS